MKRLEFQRRPDEPPAPAPSRYRRPSRPPGYTAEDYERSAYNRRTQRATVLRLERADTELERVIAASAASVARERARAESQAQAQAATGAPILTPEELEEQRRTTPRPPPRDVVTNDDLAATFEQAWGSFGQPMPVVLQVEIANLRRGGAR